MGLEIKKMLDSIESMANQRRLNQAVILTAIEEALAYVFEKGDKSEEGKSCRYRVSIDYETGEYESYRCWTVISDNAFSDMVLAEQQGEEENLSKGYISLSKAKEKDAALNIDDVIEEQVETDPLGRIQAQQAKQFIIQRMREAERDVVSEEYKNQIGTLIIGQVKRVTRDSIILDVTGGAEALLLRSEMIPRENFRMGDRVRVVLYELNDEKRGPQLLVSRKHPRLVIELFKNEVPEINEEVIEIRSAVRDAGSRAKIAVKTNDGRIDPVGACVGMRGSRVQAVSNELAGERIDIILWDDNPAQLVIKAMAPAEVSSIVVDEDSHSMDVIVEDNQLSLAIGRGGQNVRLASELSGWVLNVLSHDDAQNKKDAETNKASSVFVEKLAIDEAVAKALVAAGYGTIEELAFAEADALLALACIDEELSELIQQRASDILLTEELLGDDEADDSKPLDLKSLIGMNEAWLASLAAAGINTRDDLADLSIGELQDIIEIDDKAAGKVIMQARAHWFSEDGVMGGE